MPAPSNLGWTPTLNHFLLGSGLWGFLGGKGFFMAGPAYDAGSNVLALFRGTSFMETAGYIIVGSHLRKDFLLVFPGVRALHRWHSLPCFRLLGLGRWLAITARQHNGARAWIRRFRGVYRRSLRWVASAPWRYRLCWGLASVSSGPMGRHAPFQLTTLFIS